MKKQLSLVVGSSLLAAGAVAMSATTASALTPSSSGDCNVSGFTGVSACEGPFDGNNSNQNLDGLFGKNWESGPFVSGEIKVDNGSGGTTGGFSFTGDGDSGTWSLASSLTDTYEYGMFVVKAGNSFSSYLWDGLSSSGDWDTLGVKPVGRRGNTPGLSHFSFYGFGPREVEPPVETVPEPASMLGLLAVGVVAAGGALKQKKA